MSERARVGSVVWGSVFALAASAYFVMQTLAAGRGGASVLMLMSPVAAAVLVLVAAGLPSRQALADVPERVRWSLFLAGAAGLGLAPWLVITHRYTDAPSGSEVLFFTTASWALLGIVAAAFARDARATWLRVAVALVALVACAGILADWERPSSFSPFLKFPREEAFMLLAGVAWAWFGVVIRRASVAYGPRMPAALAVAGGVAATVGLLGMQGTLGEALASLSSPPEPAVAGAVAFGVVVLAWVRLAPVQPLSTSSALLFLPPVLLTALTFAEGLLGVTGPRPLVVAPLLASIALVVTTFVALLSDDGPPAEDTRSLPPRTIAPLALLMAAVVSLALPALRVAVSGSLPEGDAFETSFTYAGFETVGGWLAFALAVVLVVASFSGRGLYSARRSLRMAWAAGVTVAGATWLPVSAVPLHTWNRWIPPAVQQDYGTEYARITFTALPVPVQAAVVLGCVGVAMFAAGRPSGERPAER